MVASCRDGDGGERRRVESRRKYRLFYYAKAFSAVGSFRLLRAVALPIESRRRRWRRRRRRQRRRYIVGGGSSEKASAPESRKYGQPFCDKLFSARLRSSSLRSAPRRPLRAGRGDPTEARARRRRTLDTRSRAKGRGVIR